MSETGSSKPSGPQPSAAQSLHPPPHQTAYGGLATGEASFEYALADAARLYRTVYNRRAKYRSGLTQAQVRTLIHLGRNEGTNQARLAAILEVQPITLARTLDRLEADGWLERRPDPLDRRAFTLHLLEKAAPVLEEVREMAMSLRGDILKSLTAEECDVFARVLSIVRDNLASLDGDLRTANQKTAEEAAQ